MKTVHRMGNSGRISVLILLALAFLFASCMPESGTDEVPLTTVAPSPYAIAETPSPPATEVEVDAASLVEAWVRERNRFGESVEIELEEETSMIDLPGLTLYRATPLIPDMLDEHCAVYEETVWCFQEALQNIVSRFGLGSNPGQLSSQEWLALVTFFTGRVPLAGPDDLDRLDGYIPDDERAKISAPSVVPLESGGLQITFFYGEVDVAAYPDGPMALWKMEVIVTGDDAITLADREIWLSPEDLWLTPGPDD